LHFQDAAFDNVGGVGGGVVGVVGGVGKGFYSKQLQG
jgi:hypothetical protein